jgi:hypothetical protein
MLSSELESFKKRTLIFYNAVEQHRLREKTRRSRLSQCSCFAFDIVPADVPNPHAVNIVAPPNFPKPAAVAPKVSKPAVVKFSEKALVIQDSEAGSEINTEISSATLDPAETAGNGNDSADNANVYKWNPPPVYSTVSTDREANICHSDRELSSLIQELKNLPAYCSVYPCTPVTCRRIRRMISMVHWTCLPIWMLRGVTKGVR